MATDILKACKVDLSGDFDAQIRSVLINARLDRRDLEDLGRLFCDLEQALRTIWPGCVVIPLGSIVTGVGLKTSDADCYVSIPEYVDLDACLEKAQRALATKPETFQQAAAVLGTTVSIVKFLHAPTRRYCDVNFNCPMGVRDTALISHLLQMDKRVLPFAVLLKYWSMVHKITNKNFPNHCFLMLIIFFLQQVDILPSVVALQKNIKPDMLGHWNTAFDKKYRHNVSSYKSLYSLIGSFFDFYSSYKFSENVISPYTGYSLNRDLFKRVDRVPCDFGLYKENVRLGRCRSLKIEGPMCVQDLFEHDGNNAGEVDPDMMRGFFHQLSLAACQYRRCSRDEFLRAILDPKEIVRLTPCL